jgi:murein L,D-transpeptidase YafK
MLKIGNDHFETTHLEPKVDVCNRRYVFDAQPPPNSPNSLMFNPTDRCPAFVVNPKIARRALEKKRTDELEYAKLLKGDVPAAAPIYSGLDGGMRCAGGGAVHSIISGNGMTCFIQQVRQRATALN